MKELKEERIINS